uniref:Uncharacterized protein n=1 Tax=viral metagenome TaxID=1070528 RepID=A0A6C0LIC4_9ZZZZ
MRKSINTVKNVVNKVTEKVITLKDKLNGLTPHQTNLNLGKSSSSSSSPIQTKERPRTADYIRAEINRYYDRVPFKGHQQDLVTKFTLFRNELIKKLKKINKKDGLNLPRTPTRTPTRTLGGRKIKSNTPKKKVKSNKLIIKTLK